ncbi:hypothetical protein DFJ58DRAFT_340465 [Suillus subalutaceus]|uniref:uncharacterized protein n=1 Tax=Suillus subalutaceus TaxID=48586 RepID=UPI001B8673C5|nr:uncharacterized protein DFJ58DRAFT_340465 [Suillus subalutaceus]KAG1856325.1 hypothetical protein DFJ58DRAFT_340465 [Suillus subalutaceus]
MTTSLRKNPENGLIAQVSTCFKLCPKLPYNCAISYICPPTRKITFLDVVFVQHVFARNVRCCEILCLEALWLCILFRLNPLVLKARSRFTQVCIIIVHVMLAYAQGVFLTSFRTAPPPPGRSTSPRLASHLRRHGYPTISNKSVNTMRRSLLLN